MWLRLAISFMQTVKVLVVSGIVWILFNAIMGTIVMKIKSHNSYLKKQHKNDVTIICKLINRIGR